MSFKRYKLLLFLFIIIGPFLDLFSGYFLHFTSVLSDQKESSLVLSPGIFYRGFILVPIFTILTFRRYTYLQFLTFYFILLFLVANYIILLTGNEVAILKGAQRYTKLVLPIVGFGALLYLDKRTANPILNQRYVWFAASLYGLIVSISIILFFVTDLGVRTYELVTFSSKAMFIGTNPTGIILLMSLPISLYYVNTYLNKNKFIITFSLSILYLSSAVLLGSRAAILGVPSILLAFILYSLLFNKNIRGQNTNRFKFVILFILIGFIGYEIFIFWTSHNISYTIDKFYNLRAGIYRKLVGGGMAAIGKFGVIENLFGVGEYRFLITENDLVDIYGKFGLLTLIPLLIFSLRYYFSLVWLFIWKKKFSTFVLILSLSLYLIHASFAGHAMFNAQVNNLLFPILFLAHKEIMKNKVITSEQHVLL